MPGSIRRLAAPYRRQAELSLLFRSNASASAVASASPIDALEICSQCRASSAPLRDVLDAPTALAACCGFDVFHKYILYLYLYCKLSVELNERQTRLAVQPIRNSIRRRHHQCKYLAGRVAAISVYYDNASPAWQPLPQLPPTAQTQRYKRRVGLECGCPG